jgi:hypothetical protein
MEEKASDLSVEVTLTTGEIPVESAVTAPKERAVAPMDWRSFWTPIGLSILAFVAFYFSTKPNHEVFDYTYRVAGAFLKGQLGFSGPQPSWLNEMVPMNGKYYSVFPLGAVLANVPFAWLGKIGAIKGFPARAMAAALAGACVYFFFQLSAIDRSSFPRRILLALFPIFGTWTWCNLGFAGAWQIALGFALLGETAALYFTLLKPRPLIAGAWFALAFGNRTELLLTLPLFAYFWIFGRPDGEARAPASLKARFWESWRPIVWFMVVPTALALGTAAYNYARFGSVFDFGYARIPNLLNEPWYHHGLFSFNAIPWNMHKMLFEGMQDIPHFPFSQPPPFGCSIFLASPFLFLLFREGGKYRLACWLTIALLTFVLWYHGNPGGWQFSYRYATVLLPWIFLLISGNGPKKLSITETALFIVSVAINAIATYQFLWTTQIHP